MKSFLELEHGDEVTFLDPVNHQPDWEGLGWVDKVDGDLVHLKNDVVIPCKRIRACRGYVSRWLIQYIGDGKFELRGL